MTDVKQRENELTGLDQKVKNEGIQKPLNLFHQSKAEGGKQELVDGHHRLVAGLKHRPNDLVPVQHSDDADIKKKTLARSPSDSNWAEKKNVNLVDMGWD